MPAFAASVGLQPLVQRIQVVRAQSAQLQLEVEQGGNVIEARTGIVQSGLVQRLFGLEDVDHVTGTDVEAFLGCTQGGLA